MKKRLRIIAIIVLIAAVAIFFIWRFMVTPTGATITNPKPAAVTAPDWKNFKDSQIGFSYPPNFNFTPEDSYKKPVLDAYTLHASGIDSGNLSVQVRDLPDGQITSDGDYNYRQKTPANYNLSDLTVKGKNVAVFTTNQSTFERTAYFVQANKIASIYLSSVNSSDDTQTQSNFTRIVESFAWQ